ncbi:glycoside hydrolase family 28 protein [Draconibacterium sp.]|nr:glycoside hydrolase family 28 protein [Draconibacterium sp.]
MNRRNFLEGGLTAATVIVGQSFAAHQTYQPISQNKKVLCSFLFICLVGINTSLAFQKEHPKEITSINTPFKMESVQLPMIPDREFTITDFGAVPDGETMNTDAIANAIQACSKAGGGRVVIPRGLWKTGPILFKSNIELVVDEGALVLFSERFEDYPLIEAATNASRRPYRCISPIYGKGLENIAITGKGVIDGNGQAWRPVKKSKMTANQWRELVASGGVVIPSGEMWWPSKEAMNAEELIIQLLSSDSPATREDYASAREFLRPNMVVFNECRNVLLDGPTFQNSPSWNIHPFCCENVTIRNVTVRNPWFSANGDGLDLESCRNSYVYNCNFDVGDDAICIKSGKDEEGRKRGRPTEKLIVSNCIVYHGHGGFVIGSEMSGDVKDILVTNCTFIGTDVGLRFKSTRGRGGLVDNIYCENIDMINIPTDAVRFNMYYQNNSPEDALDGEMEAPAVPVTEETPRFQNIHLKNIVCRGAERAVMLQGLPEMPIRNITLENVNISANKGLACVDAQNISLKNVKIMSSSPVVSIRNGSEITLNDISGPEKSDVFLRVSGKESRQILLENIQYNDTKKKIELLNSVSQSAVIQR